MCRSKWNATLIGLLVHMFGRSSRFSCCRSLFRTYILHIFQVHVWSYYLLLILYDRSISFPLPPCQSRLKFRWKFMWVCGFSECLIFFLQSLKREFMSVAFWKSVCMYIDTHRSYHIYIMNSQSMHTFSLSLFPSRTRSPLWKLNKNSRYGNHI